ncbi:hypothetical protein GCM10009525_67230 [Streptosporangium amethystogenes subsp. fukuiense]
MYAPVAVERFEGHRDLPAGVAHRIPGGVTDAEDVVQEARPRRRGLCRPREGTGRAGEGGSAR